MVPVWFRVGFLVISPGYLCTSYLWESPPAAPGSLQAFGITTQALVVSQTEPTAKQCDGPAHQGSLRWSVEVQLIKSKSIPTGDLMPT